MERVPLFCVWLLMMAGLAEGYSWPSSQNPRSQRSRSSKSQKPNIVVIMTDDQDELLGNSFFSFFPPPPTNFLIYHGGSIAIADIMHLRD